jgi:DNA polymerase-4
VRGIDTSPVFSIGQRQPVAIAGHEFGDDTNDVAVVEGALHRLVEQVGAGLRERRLTARRIKITLDYSDGRRVARQSPVQPPTANDFRLFAVAKLTLKRAWTRRVRVRHLRLICLFVEDEEKRKKSDNLITALDNIRFRFGATAIRVGVWS